MTDGEALDFLRKIPGVSGWRPLSERAWLRAYVERQGVDIEEFDAVVIRLGGRIKDHRSSRTLGPYLGQQPVPVQRVYVLPAAVFGNDRPET